MKKFTKIMLSVAAVAAVSTAMAISAMAEGDTVTGTYAPETGVVTLDGVVSSGDQQTLLVLTENAATVTEGIIAQIDQDAAISQFVLPASIESGTYYIRIGGTDGTIQHGTLTIGGQGGEVETVTIIVGDANLDSNINASDVGYVLRYANKFTSRIGNAGEEKEKVDGTKVIVGDANLDSNINASDVGYVLRYANKFTSRIGNAGETIEVKK